MKKILLSVLSIGIVAVVAVYASQAFFSDTETSTGNVFQAGAIDLTIDNQSYYNGEASPNTSWLLKDLTVERFFNFTDLKPGDWGEDTISLHVNSNDAYLCANIQITDNSDNGITEPEDEVDGDIDGSDGTGNGDLAEELYFKFWLDDGDNVWETNEPLLTAGHASDVLGGVTYALAEFNGGVFVGPVPANTTHYIGKAWCYGDMNYLQASEDQYTSPLDYGGFTCNGESVGNISQTDRLMADISFYAVQARNNEQFTCGSVQWDNPTVSYQDLENKDASWVIMDDEIYGTIAYSSGAENFYGVVQGQGLVPNKKYQITLNGPGECTDTDHQLVAAGNNLFESGYWNNWAPNLSNTCTVDPGQGVYNMNLISDWYTFESDNEGNFVYPFNLALPSGTYTNVKVLVKKMLDSHISPWVDSSAEHTTNLFETAAINFTVN